jgi:hypothetical protein
MTKSYIGHAWRSRKLSLQGETYVHRQCLRCRRDLVQPPGSLQWKAVHVGGFRFDFLNEETSERWLAENCPGRVLLGEANAERMLGRTP